VRALRRKQVPGTVSHDEALVLWMRDVIAGHQRNAGRKLEKPRHMVGGLVPAARRQRERHTEPVQSAEQGNGPWERADLPEASEHSLGVAAAQAISAFGIDDAPVSRASASTRVRRSCRCDGGFGTPPG
jgi:hypothetical protein